jgi:hypothetical protein
VKQRSEMHRTLRPVFDTTTTRVLSTNCHTVEHGSGSARSGDGAPTCPETPRRSV